jgi:HAD superfamily hydrolase (TIGR01509 family)
VSLGLFVAEGNALLTARLEEPLISNTPFLEPKYIVQANNFDPPAAFIFDMDDLLIRSGGVWDRASQIVLERRGHAWQADLGNQYKGMNALGVTATLRRLLNLDVAPEAFLQEYRQTLLQEFAAAVEPMPGAVSLVRSLHRHRPLALASGSPLEVIEMVLGRLELAGHFQVALSSEGVERGKPHPDVFLEAARQLGVRAEECLVFEDSLVGVQAAQAAGMRCFAVPSGRHAEIAEVATQSFDSLAEIQLSDLWITG